jgi:hypothetical protein
LTLKGQGTTRLLAVKMSLVNNRIYTSDYIQEEPVFDRLQEVMSRLDDLSKSIKEVQIDLFHLFNNVRELSEVFYVAPK